MENDKVFFIPGDLVRLNKDLDNKPDKMLVIKKKTLTVKTGDYLNETKSEYFQGILCGWFDANQNYQEHVFNTKDLIKI